MRVLYTTPILEYPPAGGAELRAETSIKALARVGELFLVPRVNKAQIGGDAAEAFYKNMCHGYVYAASVESSDVNGWDAVLQPSADVTRLDGEFLVRMMDDYCIDVLWCGFGNISFPLIQRVKALRPQIKIVCDTDSVWSRFILRELPFETDPGRRQQIEQEGRRKELEERLWTDLCDVTTAVSEVDADYYRGLAKTPERVRIFVNAVDLDTYVCRPAPPPDLRQPSLLLAGTFYAPTSPMVRAARWVLDEILPLVRAKVPDAHLYIVGNMSDVMMVDVCNPNVTVTGKLQSLLPLLGNAHVALVPLMFESGTRFKILEAGACGVPLVSTTLGAEGIPVTDGHDILIADDGERFAEAIVRIITEPNLGTKLGANLQGLIARDYSLQTLSRQAEGILRSLT